MKYLIGTKVKFTPVYRKWITSSQVEIVTMPSQSKTREGIIVGGTWKCDGDIKGCYSDGRYFITKKKHFVYKISTGYYKNPEYALPKDVEEI